MVFEERLEYLKKIIKEQNKFKIYAVEQANQHLDLDISVEEMEEIKDEVHALRKQKAQTTIKVIQNANLNKDENINEKVKKEFLVFYT